MIHCKHLLSIPVLLLVAFSGQAHAQESSDNRPALEAAATTSALGMKSLPLELSSSKDNPGFAFRVFVNARRRCVFGDLDAMALDALYQISPRMLLTLEPIDQEDTEFRPLVKVLDNPSRIAASGLEFSFDLGRRRVPRLLGLFVCGDTTEHGRCNVAGKRLETITGIIKGYAGGSARSETYRAPDHIYFFRPVILEARHLSFPTKAMSPSRYVALGKLLNGIFGAGFHGGPTFQRLQQLGKTLGSMPLRERIGKVHIDLPHYDKKRCESLIGEGSSSLSSD